MKKIIALLLVTGFAAFTQPIFAADKAVKAEHTLTFWEKLRKKLNMFTPQKKLEATTAVGGVRGAQTEANDVYWKGEADQMINAEELAAFKKGVEFADGGELAKAQMAFTDFIKTHPNSPLRRDADMALAQLLKP
jgi:TolA-binding protein